MGCDGVLAVSFDLFVPELFSLPLILSAKKDEWVDVRRYVLGAYPRYVDVDDPAGVSGPHRNRCW